MLARYTRILLRFWKNCLLRDLSFRTHFLVHTGGEILWIAMALVFLKVIFANTRQVAGWNEHQYLFLMGAHLLVTSLFEMLFFSNCWRISERVRTGDLDFVLLRPANAQFLLSFERVDYTTAANLLVACGLCVYSVVALGSPITVGRVLLFLLLVAAAVAILYALVFMFAVTSIWFIRQTSMEHLWFYTVSIARYPAEIYRKFAAGVFWAVFVFVLPVLIVANLPASVMVRTFDPRMVAYMIAAAVVLLAASSLVFRVALRWYRSASS